MMEDNKVLEIIRELRAQKKTGELDDDNLLKNELKWRNEIDYDVFESFMEHINDEIRLEALGLLVESKKSTLLFIQKELDLIYKFLIFNLGERIEFVPLIKKALKRMKESLAVFRRNLLQLEKLELSKNRVEEKIENYEKLKEEIIPVVNESTLFIEKYRKFHGKLREICLAGICPGSTNTRKKNSLKIIQLQQEFLGKEFYDYSWTFEQANKIYQCLLLDTYEINKEIAYKIMMEINPHLLKLDDEKKVTEIINVALELGNSIRPIDCITASFMLKICLLSPIIEKVLKNHFKSEDFDLNNTDAIILQLIIIVIERLKGPTKLASENIIIASSKHSLYGYLTCIKSLLSICDLKKITDEKWRKTMNNIITICLSLNESVSQIVNNSSPEGHFPMDLETKDICCEIGNSDIITVTPQMVLLCSWRTVKEVSLLFGYITEKSPIDGENCEIGLLTQEQISKIGDHLVTLLCETKHRGAFEQAHVGFEKLCQRLWKLEQESLNQLPKIWLFHLLLAITGLAPGNSKLCATRRSAGVPFMVQALIASEPSVRNKSGATVFHLMMKILLGLTEIEDELDLLIKASELILNAVFFLSLETEDTVPSGISTGDLGGKVTITEVKTHALNILRALFKHAQLGDFARAYAAEGLIAAIKSYDEKTWAERNAATLLYSSLITRIFGVQRTKDHVNLTVHNKMTGRMFFEKYPKLLEFMLTELKNFIAKSDSLIKPSVQSILLILSRLYISVNSDAADVNWRINEFVDLVSACAKSCVYKTRELAARALVPLLTGKTVCTFIKKLFDIIIIEQNGSKLNLMHGYMLQILEIVKSSLITSSEILEINLEEFLNGSKWILENLEVENNKPACFPLATVYIEMIHEIIKIHYSLDNQMIFDELFERLLNHTSLQQQVLKNRPGKEIYEAAAAKLLISFMERRTKDETVINKLLETWSTILSYSNCEVQITGWMNIILAIHQTPDVRLLRSAIDIALKNMKENEKIDPDLQSVIHEFLYDVFIGNEKCLLPFSVGVNLKILARSILTIFLEKMPPESPSFFRLLGKSFGKIINDNNEKELVANLEVKVYELFSENSWTGSAGIDCRISIASVISDIYFDVRKTKRKFINGIMLDWWTTLLNLLVDDNSTVRKLASIAISKIEPPTRVKCNSSTLKIFFDKFSRCFYVEGGAAFAAYFVWSLTLCGDDYEMDDSDVFNKCYNYETFEPLRISDICGEYLTGSLDHYDIKTAFPADVQRWLSRRLNIACNECKDGQTLIALYRKRLPNLNRKLKEILDPTYNDKLLQVLAFEKFAVLEKGNHQRITWDDAEL